MHQAFDSLVQFTEIYTFQPLLVRAPHNSRVVPIFEKEIGGQLLRCAERNRHNFRVGPIFQKRGFEVPKHVN